MKKLLTSLLIILLVNMVFGQDKQKIAVYIINQSDLNIEEFVGEFFTNAIVTQGAFTAEERTTDFQNELNKEQNQQHSNTIDYVQISNIGKQFGVDFVCVVKVSAEDNRGLSIRMVNVKEAQVESGLSMSYVENSLERACKDLARVLSIRLKEMSLYHYEDYDDDEIFSLVEKAPSFPGGDSARLNYLRDNLKPQRMAKETGIYGTVYLSFIVEKDGHISNIKVMRGIGGGCDEEAIRVIKAMPKWISGEQNGHKVRVKFHMRVEFEKQEMPPMILKS